MKSRQPAIQDGRRRVASVRNHAVRGLRRGDRNRGKPAHAGWFQGHRSQWPLPLAAIALAAALCACEGGRIAKDEPCEDALRNAIPVLDTYVRRAEKRARETRDGLKPESVATVASALRAQADLERARWALSATWNAYTWERLEEETKHPDQDEDVVRSARLAAHASEGLLHQAPLSDAALQEAAAKLAKHCK